MRDGPIAGEAAAPALYPADRLRKRGSRCSLRERAEGEPDKVGIALQVHGGQQRWAKRAKCRWRNIRIRPAVGN